MADLAVAPGGPEGRGEGDRGQGERPDEQPAQRQGAAGLYHAAILYETRAELATVVKRLIEPAEVASLAGWLVSDHAGMVTGASYTMDGGWTAR